MLLVERNANGDIIMVVMIGSMAESLAVEGS
jgi:hypothetical protein